MIKMEAAFRVLVDADVKFIVVGGVAATLHGSARLTRDLDILYARHEDNLERLASALRDYKPYLRGAEPGLPFDWSAATLGKGLNFTLTTNLGDVDLLGEIAGGGTYEQLLPGCVHMMLFERDIACLSLAQLMQTKRAAGRPRDLEALAELEGIQQRRQKGGSPGTPDSDA